MFVELNEYYDVDYPIVLPGGEWVLFSAAVTEFDREQDEIVAQSLSTGERKVVLTGGRHARYVRTGHLVYFQDGRLWGVGFDPERVELIGTAVSVVESVVAADFGFSDMQFAISDDGSLVYVSDADFSFMPTLALVNRDDGAIEELKVPPADYRHPRVSPDGRRFVVTWHRDSDDTWVHDLSDGTAPRRLTFEGRNILGVWTPDGERITFASERAGESLNLYETRADGTLGVPELLASSEQDMFSEAWARDGRLLLYTETPPGEGVDDLWTLRAGDNETALYFEASGGQWNSSFSPDGKWVAYQSNETGQFQIWVQPFPKTGARYQITDLGGTAPLWSPDGKELFYVHEDELVSVGVNTDSGFTFGRPELLPLTGILVGGMQIRNFDIMPDGQHFLVVRVPEQTVQPQINIVLNWFEELKERVPAP